MSYKEFFSKIKVSIYHVASYNSRRDKYLLKRYYALIDKLEIPEFVYHNKRLISNFISEYVGDDGWSIRYPDPSSIETIHNFKDPKHAAFYLALLMCPMRLNNLGVRTIDAAMDFLIGNFDDYLDALGRGSINTMINGVKLSISWDPAIPMTIIKFGDTTIGVVGLPSKPLLNIRERSMVIKYLSSLVYEFLSTRNFYRLKNIVKVLVGRRYILLNPANNNKVLFVKDQNVDKNEFSYTDGIDRQLIRRWAKTGLCEGLSFAEMLAVL